MMCIALMGLLVRTDREKKFLLNGSKHASKLRVKSRKAFPRHILLENIVEWYKEVDEERDCTVSRRDIRQKSRTRRSTEYGVRSWRVRVVVAHPLLFYRGR